MKTTDGFEIKKGNIYFLVKDNVILKTKCSALYLSEYYGTYRCGFENHYAIFNPSDLRGSVYKIEEKAKIRLKILLKNDIKHHKNIINDNEKILEKLNEKIL